MSMQMPLDYIGIVRGFSGSHSGIDFGWNSKYGGPGHPVLAADAGVVKSVVKSSRNNYSQYLAGSERAVYGTYIIISHEGGLQTVYGHLDAGSVSVRTGERVGKGQRIASMGNTGTSSGYHLHFEVRENGVKRDALDYLYVVEGQTVSPSSALRDRIKYDTGAPLTAVGTPEDRDASREQVLVVTEVLHARTSPTLADNIMGYVAPGYYPLLESRDMRSEASNGYLWYRVAENFWMARVDGVTVIPAEIPAVNPSLDDWRTVYEIAKKYVGA